MSNNGKQNPYFPAGGGAWKKLGHPALPPSQLSATDSDKKLVLRQLAELFGSVIELNVIETIASSCGWNVQRSIDALMEVSSNVDTSLSPGKVVASNFNSLSRELKPRQSPSTAPALQAIKVAYEGYDDSSDDADVIIEDEEEVLIVANASPRLAMPPSNLSRTQPQSKPAPKEIKRGPVKCAQSLEIDVITESINRGIKIMVLMRGVPGCGKSYLAHKLISDSLLDAQPEQFIFSTDDFFCQSGHYMFSPSKLPEAHEWNRMRVASALHRGMSPVIVDNTNTEAWEMKPYVHPAVHYGYAIEILEPTTPWCRKESELCRRNTHGVPRQNIRNMLERYEKTSVADLMLRFACSYAYGNTPPQPCSNKPKLKSARKVQRENGARRKSASEPRENSWSRPADVKQGKNGEMQDKKVVSSQLPPQPQRFPKPVGLNAISVAAREKNIQATAMQKDGVKPSELRAACSANNLVAIEPPVARSANTESNLEKSATPALKDSDHDILAKMKRELKASLRSQGSREETGDLVQEMFKEDVLVRLGQREAQRTGLSVEARFEAMDREVDQLMEEMWVHFMQLNGTEIIVSNENKAAIIATESGKDAKDQRDCDTLTAGDDNEAGIEIKSTRDAEDQPDCETLATNDDNVTETEIDFRRDAKDQRDSETCANDNIKVARTETVSGETDSGLVTEAQYSCVPLAANVNLEASKDVASDLIETLIKSVDSILDSAEERGNASITMDSTDVPVFNDTEKVVDVEVANVPSIPKDFSPSAEYSLVDLVPSGPSPLTLADINTESVNDVGGNIDEPVPFHCPPSTPATQSTEVEASTAARGVFSDVFLPTEPTREPEKLAPKQSGLFSWLFPRKPAVAPESSVPSKADVVLGFRDPTFTVFDEGVNCSPEKQLRSNDQDVNLLEICNPSESKSEAVNTGDCSESSKQAEALLADDEGLSLLLDAADLNDNLDKLVYDTDAGDQTENLEKKSECLQDVSDALAHFAVEEIAMDILLSKISQPLEEKFESHGITNELFEILPVNSMPETVEKFEGHGITNELFEILPVNSMPETEEKFEGHGITNELFEILPVNLMPETVEKFEGLGITDELIEILPVNSMPEAEVKSRGLNISNCDKSFEILPPISMPGASEKSEDLFHISQPFEIPPANSDSETKDKSDVSANTDSIPDLAGFTNPWAQADLASPPPPGPPPTDSKPRKPKATRDNATNTTHADFSAANGSAPAARADFSEECSIASESTVVSARGRSINGDDDTVTGDLQGEERTRPAVFSLDKGCMTSPVESEPRQHDFDLLVNMFPRIGADDLREVFDKCRHEINWAVELLLESGYDFEPHDEVDTGFDVAQGLETTQHLLEELNTRDLDMIQEASTKQESSPQPELASFPSEPPKSEPSTSSPAAKKSPKKQSQLTLALQRQVESSVRIGESFYSEHTLKLRRQRHGESEPGAEPSEAEPDSDPEAMENEDETVVPLTLDPEFLRQLQRLFGQLPFQYPDGVPPMVQLPLALARQIHGYLIESQQQQLDKQEEYFQNMIKDEEFARRLQQEEMPAPDMREIMDMELALELYRASQRDSNPAHDDLATRLSRQKLLQRFPGVNRDVLAEVFAAHDYSYAETVDVIEASVRAGDQPVKNVLSPEALLALEKQLMKQAQEESKKQSESCVDGAAGAAGWSAVGARETPAMDSARNFREEALKLAQLRGECFRKASDAHRNGQTSVASYYARVGHLYKEHIEAANSRAAAALLAANAEDRQSTTLDLHFLYVAEAMEALDIFLDHHIAALASAGATDSRPLFIITGAGHNSAGGRARIKPAVERRLTQRKAKFVQVNPGMLKVTATKNMMLSSVL